MMVQGWRRYKWCEMADVERFAPAWLPEKFQTIGGCVNRSERQNIDFKKDQQLEKGGERLGHVHAGAGDF